ncbi:MAG: hypothetical protein Q9168_002094 [Polycauliona sp. 1 TL-2023]
MPPQEVGLLECLLTYAKSSRDLLRNIVTVNVGSGKLYEQFTLHRELLIFYSPFFRTMMNGNWEEAKTNVINLPAHEPVVFEIFQNWLYSVDLNLEHDQKMQPSLMLKLWIFGDMTQVPGFQNAALEGLRTAILGPPYEFRLKDIQTAFEHSGEGSPLRRLIVDMYVWEGPLDGLMDKFLDEKYPRAFITQVFEGYVHTFPRFAPATVKKNRPYNGSAQQYYVHHAGTGGGRGDPIETTGN